MVAGSNPFAGLAVTLCLAGLLLLPGGPLSGHAGPGIVSTAHGSAAAPAAQEYTNLSDTASAWKSDFYSVGWPVGPFSAIHLEMTLTNFGDPWDRADWVALNNVTLMDLTTLETSSGNNPVQSFSVNVTQYEALFAGPGHVWWQAMPNWISPCSSISPGCWSGVLSFQFTPGPAPPGLPMVVPVLPFATLTGAASSVNGTLHVAGSYARAEAVMFQEGQGTDEFWYVQPFASRELLWQWNNQTVLAMLPIPFINSGGALGGIDNLAEWNGTPAPGTGARPAVTADLTPWVGLLNRTAWYNFTVVDNAGSWQIGLALFLWNASDLRGVGSEGSSVNRTLGIRAASIQGQAHIRLSEPFASEQYNLSWSEYLNTTGTAFDLATGRIAVDRVVSSSVTLERVSVCRTVFNVRVDGTGAIHILDLANWTNSTRVIGNGQNATLTQQGAIAWTIDGASAGLSSTERRNATAFRHGNYSAPATYFTAATGWFDNRTSKNGVGSSSVPTSRVAGGPAVPLPGRFVVAPAAGALIRGVVRVDLLAAPTSVGSAGITLGPETLSVSANDTVTVNDPSLPNGTYELNVTSPTSDGTSGLGIPLRITGWAPPYVPPLTATASAAIAVGEVPWPASFTGSAQGGTPSYVWQWTFGDGGTASLANVTHTFTSTGYFTVGLNVTDSAGRTTHSEVGVQVLTALSVSLASSPTRWSGGRTTTVTSVVAGGLGPMNYSWGQLPSGCQLASPSGLTCHPSTVGPVSIRLLVTDSLGYSAPGWLNTSVDGTPSSPPAIGASVLVAGGIIGTGVLLAAGFLWVRYRRR
jgi:hypothetical protein